MEQTTVQTETTQPTQPTQPTSALMTTLMALVENYIRDIVTAQVNEILMNHRAMRVIDEGFDQRIKEIATDVAEDLVLRHTEDEYHMSEDDVTDKATEAVNDFDFDDKINDAVSSALDQFDFNDIIRSEIRDNITFSVSVD